MTLELLLTNLTHEFTLITTLLPETPLQLRRYKQYDFGDFFDQLCPWVHHDNYFALNSWAQVVETTSNVTLPIAAEFTGDFHEDKWINSLNTWVEFVQTTFKLLSDIFSLLPRDFKWFWPILPMNSLLKLWQFFPIHWVPRQFYILVATRTSGNCQSFHDECMDRIGQNHIKSY